MVLLPLLRAGTEKRSHQAHQALKAEPLPIVSAFEEEQQDAKKKKDVNRQYNPQLDTMLTISTKRRQTSMEPTDEIGPMAWTDFWTETIYKELKNNPLIAPKWTYCLSYDLALRKEAIELCKEKARGMQCGSMGYTERHRAPDETLAPACCYHKRA